MTLRSRIRGSNRFIPFSSCPRRSVAAIELTRRNQLTEIAIHYPIQIVKREANAVIRHPVLRKIVGPNLFFTSTGADLPATLRAVFLCLLALLMLQQPSPQD